MKKNIEIALTIFVTLCYIRFFEPAFMSNRLLNYGQFLSVFIALILGVPKMFNYPARFKFPMILLVFSLVVSIFMAMFYWDQSLEHTLLSTYEHLIVVFFFFIASSQITIRDFERIIIGMGLIYLALFFVQYVSLPAILFGKSHWGSDEFVERRGTIRFIFPSAGIFFLMSFISFNKLTQKAKPMWLFLSLSFLGIFLPIIQVTRQFIAATALIFGYNLIKSISAVNRVVLLLVLAIGVQFVLNSDIKVIEALLEQSKSDIAEGSDYIRLQAADFFLFEFSPNWVTAIFGNGIPLWNQSNYGVYIAMLQSKHGFFLEDVGIIGYYAQIGIFGVFAFALFWFYSFYYALPREYHYLKYYLWFLLLTGLTWYSIYHYHYLLITTMVLGMYQKLSETSQFDETN
ncbi:MAG: hypothetical protein ACFCUL_08575 [Flavobacteriaceae bacterium]